MSTSGSNVVISEVTQKGMQGWAWPRPHAACAGRRYSMLGTGDAEDEALYSDQLCGEASASARERPALRPGLQSSLHPQKVSVAHGLWPAGSVNVTQEGASLGPRRISVSLEVLETTALRPSVRAGDRWSALPATGD